MSDGYSCSASETSAQRSVTLAVTVIGVREMSLAPASLRRASARADARSRVDSMVDSFRSLEERARRALLVLGHGWVAVSPAELHLSHVGKGSASPSAFHASRRATRFYSLSLPFAAWWSPDKSNDMAARARTVRVPPSWSEHQRVRRAQTAGAEVSAERHKSACCSTAGEDQQGLRLCGLEGRRCMQ